MRDDLDAVEPLLRRRGKRAARLEDIVALEDEEIAERREIDGGSDRHEDARTA